MGRPLDKRAFGEFSITSCWIPGDNSASTNAPIVEQIGTNRYIAQSTVSAKKGIVTLQKASPTAAGQAQIVVIPHSNLPFGSGAAITVTMAANSATIASPGTGYTDGTVTLTVSGGSGTTINATAAGGVITAINSITAAGTFTTVTTGAKATTGGGGTGATVNLTYKVGALAVGSGGTGYTHGATLALTGNATGTLTVVGGVVTAAALGAAGSGYTATPAATVTGGTTGTNETARSIWYHRVNTWEGHQYVWNAAGTSPNANYASI